MKAIQKVFGVLSTLLLVILIALAAVVAGPQLAGYQEMAVLSGSMEPNIHVGSVIYVKETEPDTIQPGDVVTYRISSDTFVTHRVVTNDATTRTIVTKGDNNDTEDAPVSYDNILGKAQFWLPYLGYLTIYVKTPVGIMCITVLLVAIIFLNFVPMILDADKKEKKEGEMQKPKSR